MVPCSTWHFVAPAIIRSVRDRLQGVTLCLVGELIGTDSCFGGGSNPSHGWSERLGWVGSDPRFFRNEI
jgi:hypothetical protein